MREIFFAALILGCFVVQKSAELRNGFEFHDSRGRCWRCLPGESCVRCPNDFPVRRAPDFWDMACPRPTEDTCRQYPIARFPSRYARFFYQCGENGQHIRVECECDKIFDMLQQICVFSWEITSRGCDNYENTDECPCGEVCTAPDDTVTTTTTTLAPPNGPPTDPTPNGPTDSTTTLLGETTTTTGAGGGTAAPPCVCVVWWPCWCNPCWNMPCHSCNGCVG